MSAILADALETYRHMREEFELYRHAAYLRAADELRGELLNAHGRARAVDPYALFMGPAARAEQLASEELREWWRIHGRPTVEEFEADWWAGRGGVLD